MVEIIDRQIIKHFDDEGAARTPKQQRFIDALEPGKNEVIGKYRLRKGTGHAIAVGLKPSERYSCINGKWAWRKVR